MSNFQNILLTCYITQTIFLFFCLLCLVFLTITIGSISDNTTSIYGWVINIFKTKDDWYNCFDKSLARIHGAISTQTKELVINPIPEKDRLTELRWFFTEKDNAEALMLCDALEKQLVKKGKRNGNKMASNSPGV